MVGWSRYGSVERYWAGVGGELPLRPQASSRGCRHRTSRTARAPATRRCTENDHRCMYGFSGFSLKKVAAAPEKRRQTVGRPARHIQPLGEGVRERRLVGLAVVERRDDVGGLVEAALVDVLPVDADHVVEDPVAGAENGLRVQLVGQADAGREVVLVGVPQSPRLARSRRRTVSPPMTWNWLDRQLGNRALGVVGLGLRRDRAFAC